MGKVSKVSREKLSHPMLIPSIIVILILVPGMTGHYGRSYDNLMRLFVFAGSLYAIYIGWKKVTTIQNNKKNATMIVFGAIALLSNPVFRVIETHSWRGYSSEDGKFVSIVLALIATYFFTAIFMYTTKYMKSKNPLLSKELHAALAVMEEAKYSFSSQTFNEIIGYVESVARQNESGLIKSVHKGFTPRQCVYNAILRKTGDMLGSGHYHIYRGELSMQGNELLNIYNKTVDELVKSGAMNETGRKKAITHIYEAIKEVG